MHFFNFILNCEHHAFDILHYSVVPKADHLITLRLQVCCSFFIVFCLFQMLAAVQFNNEFLFDTDKIGNIVANGMFGDSCHLPPDGGSMPPRVVSSKCNSKLIVSQICPKFSFGRSGLFAEFDGAVFYFGSASGFTRHQPLPTSPNATKYTSNLGRKSDLGLNYCGHTCNYIHLPKFRAFRHLGEAGRGLNSARPFLLKFLFGFYA